MLRILLISLGLGLLSPALAAEELPADPTQPSVKVPKSLETDETVDQYKVNSLKTGTKKNLAIVNGKRVNVGDWVDGAEVIAISRKGVSLKVSGEHKFISFAERKGFSKVKSMK
ncbi:MAG: hypothetical protein ACRBB6_09990 [Neptuniibacter sp.]